VQLRGGSTCRGEEREPGRPSSSHPDFLAAEKRPACCAPRKKGLWAVPQCTKETGPVLALRKGLKQSLRKKKPDPFRGQGVPDFSRMAARKKGVGDGVVRPVTERTRKKLRVPRGKKAARGKALKPLKKIG